MRLVQAAGGGKPRRPLAGLRQPPEVERRPQQSGKQEQGEQQMRRQAEMADVIDWAQGAMVAFTHDPYLLHFLHRWWAWVVVALLIVLARKVRRSARGASVAVHSAFGTQILLGIATVWSGVALWLAVLHQAVGAMLVAATVWGVHALGRR